MRGVRAAAGFATVELALALPTLVGLVLLAAGVAGGVTTRISCAGAAAAGAGVLDDGGGGPAAVSVTRVAAPPGALVSLRALGGGLVEVRVQDTLRIPGSWGAHLPAFTVTASAVAVPPR
jgi:hypothetical protein